MRLGVAVVACSVAFFASAEAGATSPSVNDTCTDAASEACVHAAEKALAPQSHLTSRPVDVLRGATIAARACKEHYAGREHDGWSAQGCRDLAKVFERYPSFADDSKLVAALLEHEKSACAEGIGEACRNVGFASEHGIGVTRDDAVAIASYDEGCAKGFAASCEDALALKVLSPSSESLLAASPPFSPPSGSVLASVDHWLSSCATGDADACATAAQFWNPWRTPPSFRCDRPSDSADVLLPDPERARRLAAIHCGSSSESKCVKEARELDDRVAPDHCDWRNVDAFTSELARRCKKGDGRSCGDLAAFLRDPRTGISKDNEAKQRDLFERGCDFGDSGSCDALANLLEYGPDPNYAAIRDLRRRACSFQNAQRDPVCTRDWRAQNEAFFAKPLFVSVGGITTFGNASARGTLGGEVSLVHRFALKPDSPGLGGYVQGEAIAGGAGRLSAGLQANAFLFGLETGYAYASSFEGAKHVHALQITPFVTFVAGYFGLRVLVPISERSAPAAMAVVGIKVPVNIGHPLDWGPRIHLLPDD